MNKIAEIHKLSHVPVPDSLLEQLPCARWWFEVIFSMTESWLPTLEAEMDAASRRNHQDYARAFAVLYKLRQELNKVFSKDDEGKGTFHLVWQKHNSKMLPEALEGAGVTNVPLVEGIRVTATNMPRATIVPGQKDHAYAWLRQSGYGDIITMTVNSSSLSSLAKELADENKSLPPEYFATFNQKGMSVTKTNSKARKE